MVVVLVLVLVLELVACVVCVFRRSKSAPERHDQLQLELTKQKQSTDKQFTVKPHFTRHAGKAGG